MSAAIDRRRAIAQSVATALAWSTLGPSAWAQSAAGAARPAPAAAKAAKLAGTVRIVIPANAGGGWDQTGRALGAAMVAAGAADQVEYENIGGKGGTIGLAKYAEKYSNDPNTLLMGGMVMVGAVALQKPAVDMTHIQPLARLTSDYLVAAVAANSPIKTTKDLADAMRADLKAVPIAGGSAGGVDHIYAGVLARAAKANPEGLVYKPFPGGAEVVEAAWARGKGIVFLTPHLGCFELSVQGAAARWSAQHGPITILYRPAKQPWLAQMMLSARNRSGIEAVTIVIAIAVGAALPNLFLHRYIKQSNTIREQRLIKRRHLNE
mgnify:CR=1 FL=1